MSKQDPEEALAADAPEITEANDSIKKLSNSLATLMDEKDKRERELKDLKKNIDDVNKTLMGLMQNQDIKNFKTPRGTFYLRNDFHASILDQDPAFEFLRARELDGIIKQTVHHRTLASEVKRMVFEGEISLFDLEQYGIKAYVDTKVSVLGRDKTN
jgi:hypothetical protein